MKTREQITVTGDFPAADRDDAVATLAGRADAEAQRKGLSVFGGSQAMAVNTIWLRNGGECMPEQADTARVTLTAWAEPSGYAWKVEGTPGATFTDCRAEPEGDPP